MSIPNYNLILEEYQIKKAKELQINKDNITKFQIIFYKSKN
jgi:hypothetical protein